MIIGSKSVDCLADLDGLGLDEATPRAFLHDNAAAVFGLTERNTVSIPPGGSIP